MPKQRQMKYSMSGPALVREFDALVPLSPDEAETKLRGQNVYKLQLMAYMIQQVNEGKVILENITQVIVWDDPIKGQLIEIQGRGWRK